jgi:hypothetical protein
MAQIFGQAGRNAAEVSHRHTKKIVASGFLGISIIAFFSGYVAGGVFPIRAFHFGWILLVGIISCSLMWLIGKWATNKIDSIDRQRMAWRKGAVGESIVASTLADLPDGFVVVNDILNGFGNIDHVVIGPTGIYIIDAKNWKGAVKTDGHGELILNGNTLAKPTISRFLANVMDFKEKLAARTRSDHFVRGLLVFPNAYVEANFGTTREIHCLRTERLIEYLCSEIFVKRLSREEIQTIKTATLQLAGMR